MMQSTGGDARRSTDNEIAMEGRASSPVLWGTVLMRRTLPSQVRTAARNTSRHFSVLCAGNYS
jgi:hypothetical protein